MEVEGDVVPEPDALQFSAAVSDPLFGPRAWHDDENAPHVVTPLVPLA